VPLWRARLTIGETASNSVGCGTDRVGAECSDTANASSNSFTRYDEGVEVTALQR